MADFTAKDVQALRQASGAGMMDAKKALTASGGDFEAAMQTLREKGLAKADSRSDRESTDGAIALAGEGSKFALIELKSETDFSAKAEDFLAIAQGIAQHVLANGADSIADKEGEVDDLRLSKKENINVGHVSMFEAAEGNTIDAYLHTQDGRGTNGVLVEGSGVDAELLHQIALHIAFAKPSALTRDEVSTEAADKEREAVLAVTKAEGKPEQAWDKIVDGRMNKWYSEQVLLEQGMFGEKETVQEKLGSGTIVRFAHAYIGD